MMESQITYRRMMQGEEARVSEFISDVFNDYVAPGFSPEGIEEFMKYIHPDAIHSQIQENHCVFVATIDAKILGMIEIRQNNHIALFFVDGRFQRKGMGQKLLHKALEHCRSHNPEFSKLTVNASPNSTMAYKTLGFEATDVEQCVHGIRFVPMALNHARRTMA